MVQQTSRLECAWNFEDKRNRMSLGGARHTQEDCNNWCKNDDLCQHAMFLNGFCHLFETCNGSQPGSNIWTYFRKSCPNEVGNHFLSRLTNSIQSFMRSKWRNFHFVGFIDSTNIQKLGNLEY